MSFNYVHHATEEILSVYGDRVSVDIKRKNLLKFGQNENVGTSEVTIMDLQGTELSETYVNDNLIDRVVSDDNDNTQIIVIEGHTISSGLLTFVTQTITLTGTTPATLTTPLARATRMYVDDTTDLDSSPSLSDVFVYQSTSSVTSGVPDDDTKVHLVMHAGNNQSTKCATTLSQYDYLIITSVYADVNKKASALVDVKLKFRQVSTGNKVFRTQFIRSIDTNGSNNLDMLLVPHLIVPKNSDVIMTAIASTTAVSVSAGFNGLLATVI